MSIAFGAQFPFEGDMLAVVITGYVAYLWLERNRRYRKYAAWLALVAGSIVCVVTIYMFHGTLHSK